MNSRTRTTTTPSSSLPAQLEQIGVHAVAGELDDFLARATKQRWSPRQVLEHLAQAEAAERAHRSLERRLRLSEIKKFKPMADFDWSWPTKIERDVIERALTLDFLPEARNLVLVGANGLGKTMIAQNICHGAVLAGHSVLFRSAPALLEELHRQTPEGRHRKLRTYANVDLLCVDEVGYLSFDDKSADLLYEVINRRYERKSVMVTTNRPFKEWNEVFPNAACIVTLLDRLLHHADVTVIGRRELPSARKPAGNRRAAEEKVSGAAKTAVLSLAQLLAEQPAAPPLPGWIEPGLLPPQGILFVGGEPKIGKSLLVANLALALAAGQDRAGFHVPAPRRVLISQFELPLPQFVSRLEAMHR